MYAAAGQVVAAASGMPWEEFVRTRIFAPLHMTGTVPLLSKAGTMPNVASPHDRIDDTMDRAWRMLKMRRVLAEAGGGYAVLPNSRELVSYYANSVAHLLGPFEQAVRERDRLPASAVSGIRH